MPETLFDKPMSHRYDPATSFVAAEKLARTGRWDKQKLFVLEALKRHPGKTSAELAVIMNVDRYLTARRLPDLMREGLVKQGSKRYCTVNKSLAVTWWIINAALSKQMDYQKRGE